MVETTRKGASAVATLFQTADGKGAVLVEDGLVREMLLPAFDDVTVRRLSELDVPVAETPVGIRAARLLEAYWRGEKVVFDVPLLLPKEDGFRRRVLEEVARIPYGVVRTYGEIAARCGSIGAARAVGSIMARNRLPILIPCHRVVGSDGAMVGFTAPGGLSLKVRLLMGEGVAIDDRGRVNSAGRHRKTAGYEHVRPRRPS
jgi:methylated-DNA-[protein]-cysteine S-methyltransferase